MAMEFVKGVNVADLQAQLGGRLRVGDALYVTLRCAEALQHAHEQRLAHRDVKPQNILVSQLGQVKLTDLGLAKPLDEDLSLTDSGLGVGTPHYMAPEQALDSKRADHRCDIYALGVVLYGLLTGQLPFQGESALELLRAKEQGFFRPARRLNPEVPSRLDLILDKMLAADLRCRYPSCAEVAGDLRRLGLANEHLSFNVFSLGRARPPAPSAPDERVEILLIHDDPEAILLAEEALQEDGVPSNLTIVESGAEFPLFLRREGPYVSAPRPDLIFLGLDLTLPVNREVLMAVQSEEALRCVPLIILSATADPAAELEACGVRAALCISRPHDLERFRELLRADGGLAVTVLARWP
jgi:serine/threonine protein kinase